MDKSAIHLVAIYLCLPQTPPPETLVEACRDGGVMKTLQLLDEGADINASARIAVIGYYDKVSYDRKLTTPVLWFNLRCEFGWQVMTSVGTMY